MVLIPGFVHTHVHLCQTLFRGLADDLLLLDWLQQRIFPYENQHNKNSLKLSASIGIHELQTGGSTTILDMGAIGNHEVVLEELLYSGMRAVSGKCLVDMNDLYPDYKESTEDALNTSYELAKSFHNSANGRIKYGFAPRFVLSCTERVMKESFEMLNDFEGALYHSHASENKGEIEAVRELSGMENIDYFNSLGILSDKTVLAHCIHVNEEERKLLKGSKTNIAHCPSANLKLGSGIADIPGYMAEDMSVSLGADGPPCNNNLSMFTEMRLAGLIQKPIHGPDAMNARDIFRMATIGGAKALGMEDIIGSIEVGKKADLVLLDLNRPHLPLIQNDENIYSSIIYSANRECVDSVMIEGEWVVNNGVSTKYDEKEIFENGRFQLIELLKRANN